MAYREFEYQPQYAAPDTSGFLDKSTQAIANMFRALPRMQQQRVEDANRITYDLDKGAYQKDQQILTQHAFDVTQKARQDMRKLGKLSLDTEKAMKEGKGWMQMSNAQMDREKLIRQNIVDRGVRDRYYNSQTVLDKLKDAHHSDVDFSTRGQILDKIESSLDGIETFRFDNYKADYIKNIGTQYKKNEFKQSDGSYKTIYDQRTFWGDDGKPGVTDQHAIRFLESDPEGRVAQWYNTKVSEQLDKEIKQMKSSGDARFDWMKGMSNADIKNTLVNDPSKNAINKTPYGKRVRDLAKYDLNEADRVNTEVSYTGDQKDNNNSGGMWKNQNILHDDSMNSFAQEAKSASTGAMQTVVSYGPGGRFTQKSGKPILMDTTNPVRTDINKGVTTFNNKGNVKLNMTGYQLMPTKITGAPFSLKSANADDMIKEINDLPDEYFDPNGNVKLKPEMQLYLNGFTINEAGVLNDIQNERKGIATKMAEAKAANDKEKLTALEDQMYDLDELKETIASGDFDVEELEIAASKSGIKKIQKSWLIPASSSDYATINNITGGFNLKDQEYWSPDMKAVSEAYARKAQSAKANNYGAQKEQMYTLQGKQWPKSAVEKAAKASGMTIDEYIAELNKQ